MTTLRESRAGSPVTQAIVGLKNLILDPDEVPSGTIATIPQYSDKAEGDVITLKWLGVAGATYTFSVTVDASNSSAPIPIAIAYTPYIIGNLDTNVSVIYEVRRKNGSTATSSALVFRIARQLEQNLVAPTVIEASLGGTLDPINAQNGATVRVAFVGMLPTDILAAVWTIEGNPNAYETAPQNGSLGGVVNFLIPVAVVAESQGKRISVRYFVGRGGRPGAPSALLELSVRVLGQEHLPAPVVPKASGGTLDLTGFTGNASVTIAAWPLIAVGQRYWISVQGTLEDGTPRTFYVVSGQVVNQAQVGAGLSHPILRSELERLGHNSTLTVTCSVTFDGSANLENARYFPTLSLSLKTLPVQDFENFTSLPDRIYVGSSISLRFMRLFVTGSPGGFAVRNNYPPQLGTYVASWWVNDLLANVNLELTHVASAVQFQFWGNATIIARNQSGGVIYSRQHSHTIQWSWQPISIDIQGQKIKTIEIQASTPASPREGLCAQFRVIY
ncbi:hypothetical protein D3C77_363730 [compost metagenome]